PQGRGRDRRRRAGRDRGGSRARGAGCGPRTGRTARRGRRRPPRMNLARPVGRHGRANILLTRLPSAAGPLAPLSLPRGNYPPLQFPRIVVIARSGSVPARSMVLTVTRPLEQALMEVPGIRRVRSTTFRGATEISAQFDPATDMIVALQQAQNRI